MYMLHNERSYQKSVKSVGSCEEVVRCIFPLLPDSWPRGETWSRAMRWKLETGVARGGGGGGGAAVANRPAPVMINGGGDRL
jgi:hypothetical protein